ncbi:MAG: hypothetical protein Q7N50_15285 [Armatimonadota bacterium]|nr:hypothetical protein [Armatimonadota bacterium]
MSLIGLIVALAIIMIVMYIYIGGNSKPAKPGSVQEYRSRPGKALEKGHEVECQSNLGQIRSAIEIYRSENESAPASLNDIQLGTSNPDFLKCPVGGEAYVYDAQSGTVRCPHTGHERF